MADEQIRIKVRDNLENLLKDLVNDVPVYVQREIPLADDESDAINIIMLEDESEPSRKIDMRYPRNIDVSIDIFCRKLTSTDKPQDRGDTIAGLVENRILPNVFLQFPPPKHLQDPNNLEGTPGEKIVQCVSPGIVELNKVYSGLNDAVGLSINLSIEYTYEVQESYSVLCNNIHVTYNQNGTQADPDTVKDIIDINP